MLNIAIIGATGLVGKELLLLLEKKRYIHPENIFLFASKNSIKKKIFFKKTALFVQDLQEKKFYEKIQVAFFCASKNISKKYIPLLIKHKIFCIDLSAQYRLKKDVPLIIPEINSNKLMIHNYLVTSPNCTTTIMLMPLYPLHKRFHLKKYF